MTANLGCVIVAVDGSEESMYALKWALDNLKLRSSSLDSSEAPGSFIILHVQSPPSISAGLSPGAIPFGGPSTNIQTNEEIAIKLENVKTKHPQLLYESKLYRIYWSTLARDVPFAGLMVMFYEGLKDLTDYGKQKGMLNFSSVEGLVLGGLAGGMSAYLTTPLDVVKTRLQVQGTAIRYKGWLDAIHSIWRIEGAKGFFKGSIPRVTWYIPATALTFMAVEFLREQFNEKPDHNSRREVASLSIDKKGSSLQEVA